MAFATWPRKKEDKKPEENKIQEQDQDQQLDKNIQAVKNTETDTVQKKAKSINKNKATHPVAKKTPYKTKTKKAKASPEAKGLTLQTTVIMNAKNERKNLENWLKQNDRRNWDLNTDEKLIASRSKEPIYEFKDTNTTDVSLKASPKSAGNTKTMQVLLAGKPIGKLSKKVSAEIKRGKITHLDLEISGGNYKEYNPKYKSVKNYVKHFKPRLIVGLKLEN